MVVNQTWATVLRHYAECMWTKDVNLALATLSGVLSNGLKLTVSVKY